LLVKLIFDFETLATTGEDGAFSDVDSAFAS
jgi:hypothetical protein